MNHSRVNHVPQLRTTQRLDRSQFSLALSSSSSSSDLGFGRRDAAATIHRDLQRNGADSDAAVQEPSEEARDSRHG